MAAMITETNLLWNSFLKLKQEVEHTQADIESVCIFYTGQSFCIKYNYYPVSTDHYFLFVILNGKNPALSFKQSCLVSIDKNGMSCIHNNDIFSDETLQMVQLYLPLCFYSQWARASGKALAVAHFAQSLDGKIATNTGNSRWISGNENLIHAHRMRALCKGVLIGMNTLLRDKPALTVRHVEGENPVKIVVGNSNADFSSLNAVEDQVVVITNGELSLNRHIRVIKMKSKTGNLDPQEILKVIHKELDICSVYLEGGAYTASNFLIHRALYQVQMYLSPLIFGSGISNFTFPVINDVDESLKFRKHHFSPMGEGILFYGMPQ